MADWVLEIATEDELRSTYDLMAPSYVFAAVDGTLDSLLEYSRDLHGCPAAENGETGVVAGEGGCAWLQIETRRLGRDLSSDSVDDTENAHGGAGGVA